MFYMNDVIVGARNCAVICSDVKRGDEVIILTDTRTDPRIAEVLGAVSSEVGATVTTIVIPTLQHPHQEPPPPVAAALMKADVVFGALVHSISHTQTRLEANKAGVRYMGVYVDSVDTFATEGARFPPQVIFRVAEKVGEQWERGRKIRVTCARGTNLEADLKVSPYLPGLKQSRAPLGKFSKFGNFAGGFGVIGMWPNWSTNGVIYFDAVHTFKGRCKTPLRYEIRDGRVVGVEGDPEQVAFYEGVFQRFGPQARHNAELMIGLNPKTRINLEDPMHMEAHRHAGALHCAIGNQLCADAIAPEERVWPGIHLDNWLEKPTIYIDDELCVENGELVVYRDDLEIRSMLEDYGVKL